MTRAMNTKHIILFSSARYFLLIVLSLFVFETFAQRKVSGVVFDMDSTILVGLQIHEEATGNGTVTDIEGFFRLTTTKDTCFLSFEYIISALIICV